MDLFFLLICACVANEILKWVSCVQGGGGQSPELSVGCDVRFLNGDAISDENMPFFVCLYALVVLLKTLPNFRL